MVAKAILFGPLHDGLLRVGTHVVIFDFLHFPHVLFLRRPYLRDLVVGHGGHLVLLVVAHLPFAGVDGREVLRLALLRINRILLPIFVAHLYGGLQLGEHALGLFPVVLVYVYLHREVAHAARVVLLHVLMCACV